MDKKIKISELSISDLLQYDEAVNKVYDYFDNQMRANTGAYDDEKKQLYTEAVSKTKKYNTLRNKLFDEINNRVDNLV